jgi:hypothetical protein
MCEKFIRGRLASFCHITTAEHPARAIITAIFSWACGNITRAVLLAMATLRFFLLSHVSGD